jgi:hypothetical protein
MHTDRHTGTQRKRDRIHVGAKVNKILFIKVLKKKGDICATCFNVSKAVVGGAL